MDDATKIVLESIQKQITTSSESYEKILHSGLKAIRHYVDANGTVINAKLDPIKSTLHDLLVAEKKRNDKIEKLEDRTTGLEQSDSNRSAVKKALGRYFVVGCAILAAAGTVATIIYRMG